MEVTNRLWKQPLPPRGLRGGGGVLEPELARHGRARGDELRRGQRRRAHEHLQRRGPPSLRFISDDFLEECFRVFNDCFEENGVECLELFRRTV